MGAGSVLINKSPSPIEVAGDLNGDLVAFWQQLRDNTNELIRRIELTPYSRAEYVSACNIDPNLPAVERARLFFVRSRQSISGKGAPKPCNWGFETTGGKSGRLRRPLAFANAPLGLEQIANRLKLIQIENKPALDLLDRYDAPSTLFYLDPPYVGSTRNSTKCYAVEMESDADHISLLDKIVTLQSKVVLSGYDSPLYHERLKDWTVHRSEPYACHSSKTTVKPKRVETVWIKPY